VLTLHTDLDRFYAGPAWVGWFDDSEGRFDLSLANFGWQSALAPLLLESLRIRTSDLPLYDKGRRLARLIKPWMTYEQIHALFGESRAVLWDLTESRITYVDYGVSIDRCRRITFRDDSAQAKEIRWDWISAPQTDEYRRIDFGNLYWE
jgi:hypothetical protein